MFQCPKYIIIHLLLHFSQRAGSQIQCIQSMCAATNIATFPLLKITNKNDVTASVVWSHSIRIAYFLIPKNWSLTSFIQSAISFKESGKMWESRLSFVASRCIPKFQHSLAEEEEGGRGKKYLTFDMNKI